MNGRLKAIVAVFSGALLLSAWACGPPRQEETPADTLTQRQKDSIAGTLPVPGAGAVQKALEASDAARERAERHDTTLR
jgi:hypothetical protein